MNKNTYWFGHLAGLLGMITGGILFWLIGLLLTAITGLDPFFQPWQMYWLSLIIPIVLIRHFFMRRKFERTGRGVLTMVFVLVLGYFIYVRIKAGTI